jgi:O-antigen ligase
MGLETKAGGQRYLLGIWIAMGVLTPVFGFLGARGFAPGVGLMGFLCLPLARPSRKDWIGIGLLLALTLWAAVSAVWSPAAPDLHGVHSLKQLERFTALHMAVQILLSGAFIIASARLREETAERSLTWLSYGLLTMAAVLVIEGLTQATVYQRLQGVIGESVRPDLAVRNVALGGYVLAALMWPVSVTLWRQGRKLVVYGLAAVVAYSTVFLRGDSPTIALLISAVVFFAVFKLGRPAIAAVGAVAAVYFLATPWAMLGLQRAGVFTALRDHLPASWGVRLDIWAFTNGKLLEHPVLGWGLDASRMFPGLIHLHPHDGAVQIWFELGAAGAILAAAFWAFLFWRIAEDARNRLFAATACATAVVYLVIGAISFSLWQEWWICLGALAMAACVALGRFVDNPVLDWTYQPGESPKAA